MQKIRRWIFPAGLILFSVAFAFVAHIMKFGPVKICRSYVLVYVTAYLARVDMKERIVPNKVLVWLLVFQIICFVPEGLLYPGYFGAFVVSSLFGGLLGMAVLAAGNVIRKGGMGFGDIKYIGIAGFYMGTDGILFVIFLSLLSAAIYCGIMLLMKKLTAKDEVPLMPFLFGGLLATCLLGI